MIEMILFKYSLNKKMLLDLSINLLLKIQFRTSDKISKAATMSEK